MGEKLMPYPRMKVRLIAKPAVLHFDSRLRIGDIYVITSLGSLITEDNYIKKQETISYFVSVWIEVETLDGHYIDNIYPSFIFEPAVLDWKDKIFNLLKQNLWKERT